mgnify:CR=1 FL=1
MRPDPSRDWLALNIREKPPTCLRGGAIFPVEHDQWMVTLAGYGKDYPPTEEEGFLAFARSLRTTALYDAIKDAEPLSPIHSTRSSANVVHHYEEMATWPAGLVATGDAACAFNPVYGQGMTTATLGAALLGDCLCQQRQESGNVLDGLGQRGSSPPARTCRCPGRKDPSPVPRRRPCIATWIASCA